MTLATQSTSRLSDLARSRFEALDGEPAMVLDLSRVVLLHLTMDARGLSPISGFAPAIEEGRVFLTLVMGSILRLRMRSAADSPGWGSADSPIPWMCLTLAGDVDGEPARLVLLDGCDPHRGRQLPRGAYGLDGAVSAFALSHEPEQGSLGGRLRLPAGDIAYHASLDPAASYLPAESGSLAEFLLERYVLCTTRRGIRRQCRLWHRPWAQAGIEVTLAGWEALQATLRPWCSRPPVLRQVAAHYSPGLPDVWISPPRCRQGEACARTWSAESLAAVASGLA